MKKMAGYYPGKKSGRNREVDREVIPFQFSTNLKAGKKKSRNKNRLDNPDPDNVPGPWF